MRKSTWLADPNESVVEAHPELVSSSLFIGLLYCFPFLLVKPMKNKYMLGLGHFIYLLEFHLPFELN